MVQHLSQEVNDLVRSNPFLMQGEQEVSLPADRRKGGDSSPFASDLPLGCLSTWCPRLPEEGCQRNVRFVLKIENRPVFPHCFPYLGQCLFQPFLTCLLIRLEVLTFRFLVRQPCLTKPSPDRVPRHNDLQLRLYDLMYPCYGPKISFKSEPCRRLENEVPEALAVYSSQLPGPSAPNLPMQPSFSIPLVPFHPSKQGRAICIVCPRNLANGHALAQDCLHCSCPNFIRRVPSVTHSDGLSRHKRLASILMLQIYCDEPYDRLAHDQLDVDGHNGLLITQAGGAGVPLVLTGANTYTGQNDRVRRRGAISAAPIPCPPPARSTSAGARSTWAATRSPRPGQASASTADRCITARWSSRGRNSVSAGTISANLGGTAGLSMAGPGTLVLSGTNTYGGATT